MKISQTHISRYLIHPSNDPLYKKLSMPYLISVGGTVSNLSQMIYWLVSRNMVWVWCWTPLIQPFGMQKQVDISENEPAWSIGQLGLEGDPVLKRPKITTKKGRDKRKKMEDEDHRTVILWPLCINSPTIFHYSMVDFHQ